MDGSGKGVRWLLHAAVAVEGALAVPAVVAARSVDGLSLDLLPGRAVDLPAPRAAATGTLDGVQGSAIHGGQPLRGHVENVRCSVAEGPRPLADDRLHACLGGTNLGLKNRRDEAQPGLDLVREPQAALLQQVGLELEDAAQGSSVAALEGLAGTSAPRAAERGPGARCPRRQSSGHGTNRSHSPGPGPPRDGTGLSQNGYG